MPLNCLSSVKTAKYSLPRGHMGGANCGYLELGPGTPPWVRGSIYKKKVPQDWVHNTPRSFAPPPPTPHPSKRGTQVRQEYRGQNQKNHWGIIFGPTMMILQGVGRQKPYIGICYANDPKKGGYTTPAPGLDLTTSLGGDFTYSDPPPLKSSSCGTPHSTLLRASAMKTLQASI